MNEKVQVLREELADCRTTLRELLKSGDQLLAVVVTIAAGVLALSDRSDLRIVLSGLPVALLGVATYVLRLNALIQHLGGYRMALEDALNREIGEAVLVWERRIAPQLKRSFSSSLNTAYFALVWLAALIAAFVAVIGSSWNPIACVAYLVFLGLWSTMLALAYFKGMRLFDAALSAAVSSFGNQLSP